LVYCLYMNTAAPPLSIIIIARNEEATLSQNLEVLLPEARQLNAEVIVVDSASTDRTAQIARDHAVTLVQLQKGSLLTPAAARHVGSLFARGQYLYYMDGDMILVSGWLREGVRSLADTTVAGVAGRLLNVNPGDELSLAREDDLPLGDVETLHTSAMYRRDVLLKTGGFNPFLRGEEERELGYRILMAGYRLKRLPVPMGYHCFKKPTVALADRKSGYFAGQGQIFRTYCCTTLARAIFAESLPVYLQVFAVYTAILSPFVAAILFLVSGWTPPVMIIFATVLIGLLILTTRKGLKKVFLHIRSRLLILRYLIEGFLVGLPAPTGYWQKISLTSTNGEGKEIAPAADWEPRQKETE
jgi:glycosyltransferase involved in cell wall biosynthesis